jgi:hypothetical protein
MVTEHQDPLSIRAVALQGSASGHNLSFYRGNWSAIHNPAFAAGKGHIYADVEDKANVAVTDAKMMTAID